MMYEYHFICEKYFRTPSQQYVHNKCMDIYTDPDKKGTPSTVKTKHSGDLKKLRETRVLDKEVSMTCV